MSDIVPQKPSTPRLPSNETERLVALHRYRILDTPPEAAFDRITRLAARLFDMPIALISLVDESRAWFKSCIGFGASEVPRDDTLCSFAVLTDEPLIVPDARLDDRFACNPFVQSEPGVRFYAGAPLLSHDGFNLGTLCLLDGQPRAPLTTEQQATLVDLAAMVVDELELRLAAHRIAQIDVALRSITQSVATVTGEAFLDALVQHFATVLDVDYAYIGLVEGDHPRMLRTIATCAHGQIVENLAYPLQDTPCWEVIEQRKICCYPRHVQAHFPNAPLLKPLSVESYVAIPFLDSSGTPLGLLGVMDREPLEDTHLAESVLTVFADRIATELERQQAEAALRESEERFRNMADNASVMVWVTDPTGYCTYLSQSWYNFTGQTEETGLGFGWLRRVHPDDQAISERIFLEANRQQEAFSLEYRLQNKQGAYIWAIDAAKPWFGVNGQFKGYIGSVLDISDRKQAEAALQQQTTLLQLIIDSIGDGLILANPQGEFVLVNQAAARFFGSLTHERLYDGWSQTDGLHLPDQKTLFPNWQLPLYRAMQGEFASDVEVFVQRDLTAEGRWVSISGFPIRDQGGAITGGVITCRDVTERKQAEAALRESENCLRLALKSAALGTWDFNPITGILQWDEQCKAMFGLLPIAEINYGIFLAGLHPADRDYTHQLVQRSLTPESGGEYELEYRTIGIEDGVERWIAAKGKAFFNSAGIAIRFIGTVLNITDVKRAEAEREQLLQREQAARAEAERANRIKDEFLAVLSHELRSPLNPILGWTRLLQNGKLDATRQREALATIERNAKLQTQLIDDLLDISRIMQGKLSLTVTPVSLTFVITAAVETVRLAAEAKQIQILLDLTAATPPVSGDAARLQQVVWNLLTNAVKFTPNSGQVTIELRQLDHLAQIRVTDTGKGIDPQFLPHVFEYFRQADATTTRKFGGLGLGLAIVRQIVEMHGGTVWAESEGENQGAIFTVQLPLNLQARASEPEPPHASAMTEAPLSHLQILLVDDETDTREFQAFLLEQSGASVTAVASGFEALQALDEFLPDVLVSDVGMAEMNGYMLMQQIRLRSPSKGGLIPAIALTAYARDFDRQQALQAGFQRHLTKPIEPQTLLEAITELNLAHTRQLEG